MHTSNSSIVSTDAACSGGTKASDSRAISGLGERKIELCPLSRLKPFKNNARTTSTHPGGSPAVASRRDLPG
jgi:hypothetical protein